MRIPRLPSLALRTRKVLLSSPQQLVMLVMLVMLVVGVVVVVLQQAVEVEAEVS